MMKAKQEQTEGVALPEKARVFRGLKANQLIRCKVPNGQRLDLKTGKIIQEFKVIRARVHPLLMFETHVVVKHGSFGQVVNEENIV